MLAKVNPFLRPLLDALSDILDFEQVQRYLDREVIEIIPLAFMRGRTLNNTFMILDEAQNTTITQMKMFLTRMGHHSKIVVTGDATQTDLPDKVESGLIDAWHRLRGVEGIATIELSGADIVRHPLVRRIVAAYDTDRRNGSDQKYGADRKDRADRGHLMTTAVASLDEQASLRDTMAVTNSVNVDDLESMPLHVEVDPSAVPSYGRMLTEM